MEHFITIQPWHWFLLALILIAAEIFTASFAILWFGIAAFIVSFLLWFMPELLPTWQIQVLTWTILSIFSAIFWFKFAQPIRTKSDTKKAVENGLLIGEIGFILKPPVVAASGTTYTGIVRFHVPKVGADEWPCYDVDSKETGESTLKMGSKVMVVDVVEGNKLVVQFVKDE